MSGPRRLAVLVACAVGLALIVSGSSLSIARPSAVSPAYATRGYAVIPWANQSLKVLDSRTAWLPPLVGFTLAGLLLSHDPYAAAPSAVAAISSPAPLGGIADYDYRTGVTRNLTFPYSLTGASWPGAVTPFTRAGNTYLLSLAPGGSGLSGPALRYMGEDVQIVAAGILDYPAFAHFVPVNLSIPLTTMGFEYNQSVDLTYGVVPDGSNLTAIVEVSAYSGGGFFVTPQAPWAKFVYTTDLSQTAWTDGQPVVLAPRATLPWALPMDPGFQMFLTKSEMLVVTPNPGGTETNVQFVDVDRLTRWNTSLPGRSVVWHGRIGPHLYLLENNWQNASYDEYVMNRIDLDATGAATAAKVAWDRLIPRPTGQSSDVAVVTGGRVDFFVGSNGLYGFGVPRLSSVYSYDIVCGMLLSVTNLTLQMPALNGFLISLAYPDLGDVGVFQSFVADTKNGILYPLDLSVITDAVLAYRQAGGCSSCTYAIYVTKNVFPKLDLLIEEQYEPTVFGSSPVTNLTAVELTTNASMPPPLPVVFVSCGAGTGAVGNGEISWAVLLFIGAFAVAGALLIVATVVLAWRRPPGGRREPPKPPPG